MQKETFDKIAFIEIKDRKLLVALNKGNDIWYIPGGKREKSETDLQTLTREVKEEFMVDIIPDSAKLYGVFEAQAHNKPQGVMVKMICYTASYTGTLVPSAEVVKMAYLTHSQKNLCSAVDKLIFEDLKEKGLID